MGWTGEHTNALRQVPCLFIYSSVFFYMSPVHRSVSMRQADFNTKCRLIQERLESRSSQKLGQWFTEEQLRKSGQYTAANVKNIVSYCKKFPESLMRQDGWKEGLLIP